MWKRDGKQGCETLYTLPLAVNDMACSVETKKKKALLCLNAISSEACLY